MKTVEFELNLIIEQHKLYQELLNERKRLDIVNLKLKNTEHSEFYKIEKAYCECRIKNCEIDIVNIVEMISHYFNKGEEWALLYDKVICDTFNEYQIVKEKEYAELKKAYKKIKGELNE